MRIVIAGGHDQADFLIGSLLRKKHQVCVINDDVDYCDYLSKKYNAYYFIGDPSKQFVLEEAGIDEYDVIIALTSDDADNLAICQYAKKLFKIPKTICTVSNPKHVEVFKKLGINTVISATYMVAEYIAQATDLKDLINTLSFGDGKAIISEVVIEENYNCAEKPVMDISFPKDAIIGCIIRHANMIVPSGTTVLKTGDKLMLITSPQSQTQAINAIRGNQDGSI